MAHFARISDGHVIDMHVLNNDVITEEGVEREQLGQEFLAGLWGGEPSDYIQCSYNGNPINGEDRGGYPSTGWVWDGSTFVGPVMPGGGE